MLQSLYLSKLFSLLILVYYTFSDVNMVELQTDGRWKPIADHTTDDEEITGGNRHTKRRKAYSKTEINNHEVIVLDSSDDDDAAPTPAPAPEAAPEMQIATNI